MTSALLLSGGMDSTAIAWWKRPEICITIDYGQTPARAEVRASAAVANAIHASHHVISVDLRSLGSGDMAGQQPLKIAPVTEWWPYRNQMLITLAGMKAISLGVKKILIGCLRTDGMHADGRPEFIKALDSLMLLQEGALAIEAPAVALDAMELVEISKVPLDILAWAHSCHVSEYACGECRGCRKHYETLNGLGVPPY